ncbi:MAG: RloB domain-containing protein [Deltaproteobacteria bacterium]|nr:RloB domain-containing protein [Deltaproteobacteria bacterium]
MREPGHKRSYGNIPYRRLFLIFPEGRLTESQYFSMFLSRKFTVKIFSNNRKSDPIHILQKATDYVRKHGVKTGDHVWMVIDRDTWPEEQLMGVCTVCREQGGWYRCQQSLF